MNPLRIFRRPKPASPPSPLDEAEANRERLERQEAEITERFARVMAIMTYGDRTEVIGNG